MREWLQHERGVQQAEAARTPLCLPYPCLMLVTRPMEETVLRRVVPAAVEGGADAVQIRDKTARPQNLLEILARLKEVLPNTLFLLNGCLNSAEESCAHGLHLSEQMSYVLPIKELKAKHPLIGCSVHTLDAAKQAEAEGADYLVAGTIFSSPTHAHIQPAGLDFLHSICKAASIPVLAIGGIKPNRVKDCLLAGAYGVAVLSTILDAENPGAAAHEYRIALDMAWQELKREKQVIELRINGDICLLESPILLSEFLLERRLQGKWIVVERNHEIVPRETYTEVTLQAGDELEIVQMMAGG